MHSPANGISSYRRDIDGLRAVAVLPVVFYHAGTGFTGGYVGVDVFFVISGFLITRLLARDLEDGRFSLLEFWHRRVRRIFPALFVMVLLTLIAGGFLMIPADYKELGQSALAQSLLAANFFFWDDTGYFARAAESKPLLHTWSLAVEEQFYVLFPLVLAWLWRGGRVRVRRMLGVALLVSLAASLPGPAWFPTTAFYLLPTRAWELLLGAILVFMPEPKKAVAAFSGPAGLIMILASVFLYTVNTPFPGIAAVLPCVGAALVIWSGSAMQTWAHRLLSWRPVVFIGLISYSLYLWHWPVLVYSRKFLLGEPSPAFIAVQIGLSLLLAVLSWRFVETPFREKRWLPDRPRMLRFGIVCTVISALLGAALSATKGLRARLPAAVRQLTENPPGMNYDPNIEVSLADLQADRVPVIGDRAAAGEPAFVLWGDSHAMAAHPVLDVLGRDHRQKGVAITRRGTTPLLGTWRPAEGKAALEFHQAALDYIRRHRVPVVVLVSYWANYTEGSATGSSEFFITDDETLPLNAETGLAVLERGLQRTLQALRESGVRQIAILRQVPEQPIHVKDVLAARMLAGLSIEHLGASRESYRKRQQRVDATLARILAPDVRILDPESRLFGPDDRTILIHNGRVTFEDEGHVSVEGALLMKPVFEPVFAP